MKSTDWKQAAHFVGAFVRGGNWEVGLEVAKYVAVDDGRGGKLQDLAVSGRASIAAFAEEADLSRPTIAKYLATWEHAAKAGLVDYSADLSPEDEYDWEASELTDKIWATHYGKAVALPPPWLPEVNPKTGKPYAPLERRKGADRHVAQEHLVSKKTIKAAIEKDPSLLKDVVKSGSQKVRKAARDGVVEANAEAQERAGRAAETAAVERGNPPMGPDSDEEELGAAQLRQGDYAVAEAKRRDWVWELERDAKALHAKYLAGAEEFGHTGVPDEVEVLKSAVHYATEFAFGVNDFIIETTSEEARK